MVEDLYTEYKFPRTAILMGHARGVIYLAARQLGVTVLALAPVGGQARHDRQRRGGQGARCSARSRPLLGLKELPRPSHVADALGLAATGMARITGRVPARGRPDTGASLHLRGPRNGPRTPRRPLIPSRSRATVIASLRGKLRRKLEDRVVVEAAGVGYEVFLPPVTQQALVRRQGRATGTRPTRCRSRSTTTPPRTSRGRC